MLKIISSVAYVFICSYLLTLVIKFHDLKDYEQTMICSIIILALTIAMVYILKPKE